MPTLESFLAEQQVMVEDLERKAGHAYWACSLSGKKEDEDRAAALSTEVQKAYASTERLQRLLSFDSPTDHNLARQRQLLIDSYRGHQLSDAELEDLSKREMEIESLFSNFRATLGDKSVTDNDLHTIFRESNDSRLRRSAWDASKQIGTAVADKVLALVRLRNTIAKRLGYANYYAMQIELQEFDLDLLFNLLDTVSEKITPHFDAYKSQLDQSLSTRFSVDVDQLMPWHYSNPFFQDAPESDEINLDQYFAGRALTQIADRFFSAVGFDIAHLLERSDLYEKPGKMQHAYCTSIGRGTHDIRVLCNIVPNAKWMATLLHELGHAIYDDHVDDDLPFFLREYAHTMTTEAIAELMGRLVNNGAWLQTYAGVAEADARQVQTASETTNRAHLLIFTQWVLVMSHFERSLYEDPEQDLDKLWWNLVERFQHLRRPDGDRKADWAAKIHLSTSPVYYHNYLLGEMTASQILASLKKNVVSDDMELVTSPKVGEWLTEKIFRHGAKYNWNILLERATGERLNPAYFIDELVYQQ
jgi:peptidyl-dipeptidase A